MRKTWFPLLVFAALLPVWGRQSSEPSVRLLQDPAVKAALETAKATEALTIEDQIRLSEIPAPSFDEGARAAAVKQIFKRFGDRLLNLDIPEYRS